VLPECNASQGSNCCAFPDVACRGSFGPAITPTLSYDGSGHQNRAEDGSIMQRMRPIRGEPAMVMSDQQARLSGRKRGCQSSSSLSLAIYKIF
jgi:hypothetical protein